MIIKAFAMAVNFTKCWFSKLPLKIYRSFVYFPTERLNETVCYSDITL